MVLADLSPQSAILGWYQEDNFRILKNQILLIFKMTVYKDRELGVYSLERFINKLKLVRKIEYEINTNNEYNRNKTNVISGHPKYTMMPLHVPRVLGDHVPRFSGDQQTN